VLLTPLALVTVTGTWKDFDPNWSGPGAQPVPVVLAGAVGLAVVFWTTRMPPPPALKKWKASLSTHAAPLAMSHAFVFTRAETRTQSKSIDPKVSRGVPGRLRPVVVSALDEGFPMEVENPADGVFNQRSETKMGAVTVELWFATKASL